MVQLPELTTTMACLGQSPRNERRITKRKLWNFHNEGTIRRQNVHGGSFLPFILVIHQTFIVFYSGSWGQQLSTDRHFELGKYFV